MILRRAPLLLILIAGTGAARPRIHPSVRLARGEAWVSVRADGGGLRALRDRFPRAKEIGGVAWLRVRPSEIDALAATEGVRSVEPARLLHPSLDASVALTGALTVRRDRPDLDGRGVVVGVIDTGCDVRHADLRDPSGRTRVAALLDLSLPPDGRHADLAGYGGRVWLQAEIDAALTAERDGRTPAVPVEQVDTDGHGTHVAGIVAGSGRATGNGLPAGRYAGMAPLATIVCVKAAREGNAFAAPDVLTGLRFVIDRARSLGAPAALNLSMNGDGGPHDGTSHLERALDELVPLSTAGRALVVAAGNAGARDHHAGGYASGAVEVALTLAKGASGEIAVELWSDRSPSLALIAPTGRVFGPVAAGARRGATADHAEGMVSLDNGSDGADPDTGRRLAVISVRGSRGGAPEGGAWRIAMDFGGGDAPARWDAWLIGVPPGAATPRFVDHLDSGGSAQTPAFARSAIAVGSFVSKSDWITRAGTPFARGLTVGAASAFSGAGPASDGRFVPDLVAPGEFVAAALSSRALPTEPGSAFHTGAADEFLWADDGVHGLLRGTSQAAPHVAGAAALLLQIDPALTPDRVREVLRASAAVEEGAPGWSPRAGFGRLDVAGAIALLERRDPGRVDPLASTVGVSRDALPVGRTRVSVVPRDARRTSLGAGRTVSIEALLDGSDASRARWDGPVRDLGAGRYERTLLAGAPRNGAFTITVTVDGTRLAARPVVWFVSDRGDAGRPFAASGGCSVGRSAHGLPLALLLLAAWATRRRLARSYRDG